MQVPSHLTLQSRVNGLPFSGVFCLVRLKALRKNDFTAIIGPTRNDGILRVGWNEIVEQILDDIRLGQMDYASLSNDFSGDIEIEPLNIRCLKGALDAYQIYRGIGRYPKNWQDCLQRAIAALQRLPSEASIECSVDHDGKDIRISTRSTLP